jgi:hypothetical protein
MEEFNYFNYYTEIEEYFWRKRGSHVLVSPLDWAIVETWQKAGIPVEVVLKGIDRAFESYRRSRRAQAGRPLKTLIYCVDAVLDAAAEAREAAAGGGRESRSSPASNPFSASELGAYFDRNADRFRSAAERERPSRADLAARFEEIARKLAERRSELDAGGSQVDLEDLERALTVLEEKLTAALTAAAPDEVMMEIRRELDRSLARYRRKMTAEQIALLERQYIQKRLFETFGLPRLSLFYMT